MHSGMATRITSSGSCTMYSPLRENMTRIVKSRAIKVMGLILGMNFCSYHSFPFVLSPITRETMPAIKGMPRYINTLSAICPMDISTIAPAQDS